MKDHTEQYPYIIPEYSDWPIYKLSQDREQFIEDISKFTMDRLQIEHKGKISELLARVIYLERRRILENPWKADPPHEIKFWNQMRQSLIRDALDKDSAEAEMKELVILKRS